MSISDHKTAPAELILKLVAALRSRWLIFNVSIITQMLVVLLIITRATYRSLSLESNNQ
jgi:hypothetical protein